MIFAPSPVGNGRLTRVELEKDKRECKKIGPCGVGEKALYLNSFYLRRRYYIVWSDVRRVFKRVAMSKGGFSGHGIFGSMPYLVVLKSDGTEEQCIFKFENQVDEMLEEIGQRHPEIPLHSQESEQKLAKAKAEQEAKYTDKLSQNARDSLLALQESSEYLERKPENYKVLVYAAKQKRSVDGTKPSLLTAAWLIVACSIVMIVGGLYLRFAIDNPLGLYLCLFGGAFILSVAASQILPTPNRNKKTVQRDWDEAVSLMTKYLHDFHGTVSQDRESFPVPAQYAHPVVLTRMVRVIREGRAEDLSSALAIVKQDLRALNKDVKVSQQEYDEVVTVKPMFLVCNYS